MPKHQYKRKKKSRFKIEDVNKRIVDWQKRAKKINLDLKKQNEDFEFSPKKSQAEIKLAIVMNERRKFLMGGR